MAMEAITPEGATLGHHGPICLIQTDHRLTGKTGQPWEPLTSCDDANMFSNPYNVGKCNGDQWGYIHQI